MKMISRIAAAMALLVVGVGTTTLHADTFDRAATQVVAFAAETGQTVLSKHVLPPADWPFGPLSPPVAPYSSTPAR